MKRRIIKTVLFGCLLAVIFAIPFFVQAETGGSTNNSSALGSIGNSEVLVIGPPVKWLMYLVLVIESFFITLGGMLASVALEFNKTILDFNPPFIVVGWNIFRDIANLGFVLGIVLIAIMTILRVKGYQAQQILWKLIVAALLVNFSLLIGGALITPANSISTFLLNYIGSGNGGTVAKLGDSFRFVDLINSGGMVGSSTGEFFGWITGGIIGNSATFFILATMAILLVLGFIILLTLFSFAGMLFVRYFMLAFLLMISPVVWLMWIFPGTKNYFKEWWENFIHWVIYAPFMLLFLYISLLILDKYPDSIAATANSQFDGLKNGDLGIDFGLLMTSLFSVAILIGGLRLASKMGHGGTKLALGAVDSGQKWAKNKMSDYRQRGVDVAKRTESRGRKAGLEAKWGGQLIQSGLKKIAGSNNTILKSRGIQKLAEVGMIGIENQKIKTAKTIQGYTEGEKKKFKDYSPDQLYSVLGSVKDPEKRAAMLELIGDKDKKYDAKKIKAAGMGDAEMEEMFLRMMKIGRAKEASKMMKRMGVSPNMYEYNRKKKAGKSNKYEGDTGISNIGTDSEYIYSDREKDEKGKPKRIYRKDVINELEKYSEQDIKDLAASVGKDMFSTFPPKNNKFVPDEFSDDITKKIMDMQIDPFSKFYQSFSSKLDRGELKNHYVATVDHLIKNIDKKVDSVVLRTASTAFGAKKYEAAVDELKKSNNPDISQMAKKLDKSIGAQLTFVSKEEEKTGGGGGGGNEEKKEKNNA